MRKKSITEVATMKPQPFATSRPWASPSPDASRETTVLDTWIQALPTAR